MTDQCLLQRLKNPPLNAVVVVVGLIVIVIVIVVLLLHGAHCDIARDGETR